MAAPSIWRLAVSGGTPLASLKAALVVGTVLVAINQADLIAGGIWPPVWKMVMTYMVPYCVSTWGAVAAKRAALRALSA